MNYAKILVLGSFCWCATGCDAPEPPKVHKVSVLPRLQPLGDVPRVDTTSKEVDLTLSDAVRYADCTETLDRKDAAQMFPMSPADRLPFAIGCGMEAYSVLTDGSFVTAHAVTRETSRDLRVSRWDATGKRLWTVDMDRSAEMRNFTANFRESWLADLAPDHLCAGTMWEGGTQGVCVKRDDGSVIWDGWMAFWAGSKPVGYDGGLYVSDVSGVSQRYPFSGIEMRFRKFDGAGGRSSLYLNGVDHVLFAPARAEEPRIIRYDFQSLEPVWRLSLPTNPTAGFGISRDAADIIGLGEELLAVNPVNGKPLWRRPLPEPRAPIAARRDTLYLLERKTDLPNVLHAIDLKSGAAKWHATTPLGTLSVHALDERVFLKSVRSVQEVLEPR